MQYSCSDGSPEQVRPPLAGAGLVQVLDREWVGTLMPDAKHVDQSDHVAQLPLTVQDTKENIDL